MDHKDNSYIYIMHFHVKSALGWEIITINFHNSIITCRESKQELELRQRSTKRESNKTLLGDHSIIQHPQQITPSIASGIKLV